VQIATRTDRRRPCPRICTGATIALPTAANLFVGVRLVIDIITGDKLSENDAPALPATGGVAIKILK
jgi:hypothetical protein